MVEDEPYIRHLGPDRLFHWLMALATISLGITAFLPILGIKFDWVPLHWISGIVLTLAIFFHLIRVFFFLKLREMMPSIADYKAALKLWGREKEPIDTLAKYDFLQKSYHWTVAVVILLATITGLLMLAKIDTIFWSRNPSILSDSQWGIIYVIHGFAALGLIFLFLVHVYFSLLPEHRALLVSIIFGRGPRSGHSK